MIIFLFLIAVVIQSSSDITLTLTSGTASKVIPVLQPCSCQLAVFPVYSYFYNVTVDVLTARTYQYVQIYVPSQATCQNFPLNLSKTATLTVDNVTFADDLSEVTEKIYINLID
jgi:hypothetical protein